MLDSIRKYVVALPQVPAQAVLTVGTVASFAWLLSHNWIHPIIVYGLQVYLTF
jgi:hypothetical protein